MESSMHLKVQVEETQENDWTSCITRHFVIKKFEICACLR